MLVYAVIETGGKQVGGMGRARVLRQGRGRKIRVMKYKPKAHYRRRTGHRQAFTELRIEKIEVGGPAPSGETGTGRGDARRGRPAPGSAPGQRRGGPRSTGGVGPIAVRPRVPRARASSFRGVPCSSIRRASTSKPGTGGTASSPSAGRSSSPRAVPTAGTAGGAGTSSSSPTLG